MENIFEKTQARVPRRKHPYYACLNFWENIFGKTLTRFRVKNTSSPELGRMSGHLGRILGRIFFTCNTLKYNLLDQFFAVGADLFNFYPYMRVTHTYPSSIIILTLHVTYIHPPHPPHPPQNKHNKLGINELQV